MSSVAGTSESKIGLRFRSFGELRLRSLRSETFEDLLIYQITWLVCASPDQTSVHRAPFRWITVENRLEFDSGLFGHGGVLAHRDSILPQYVMNGVGQRGVRSKQVQFG